MSSINDAIQILEQFQDGLPRLEQDELESRLDDLEGAARALANNIDVIRQAEVHQLDDQISSAVSEAESLADSIQSLYSDV